MVNLADYFFGKDVLEFYKNREINHPEEKKKLNRELFVYWGIGKVFPNIVDLAGLSLIACGHPGYGAMFLGSSEGLRNGLESRFLDKRMDYVCEDFHKTADKVIEDFHKTSDKVISKLNELNSKADRA